MEWNKYTIKTVTQAEDAICGVLAEVGITGFEIEDNVQISEADKKEMYIDILAELPEDEGIAYVSFYLEEDAEEDKILIDVNKKLDALREYIDIGEGRIFTSHTKEEDWINNWKEFFKPFSVEDIIIKPTWEKLDCETKDKIVIEIDPGTAFGTGQHETTKLCILQLKKYINGQKDVLDVGCGSGILSIIANKLGAKYVFGTDIDERAVSAAIENADVNHLDKEKYCFIKGNIIDDIQTKDAVGYEKYDVVVANILADVIVPLSAHISKHMKKGAYFITSGIINTKEEEVKAAIIENGFNIVEITRLNDWVSITARWE